MDRLAAGTGKLVCVRRELGRLQDLVDQKQVREQGAQMDGRVQVVDQLRTDAGWARTSSMAASESLASRSSTLEECPPLFRTAGA